MSCKGFSDIAADMQAQTAGCETKADKIRALAKAGHTRQQIADFLGIRYQHVRNVLVDDERRIKATAGPAPRDAAAGLEMKSASPGAEKPPREAKRTVKVKLGPGNQLAIPPHMLEALGWKEGDTIWVHLEGEGEIRLQDVYALTRTVQAYVREHLPNMGSVDDFLAWRREEAEREEQEMQRWLGDSEHENQDD